MYGFMSILVYMELRNCWFRGNKTYTVSLLVHLRFLSLSVPLPTPLLSLSLPYPPPLPTGLAPNFTRTCWLALLLTFLFVSFVILLLVPYAVAASFVAFAAHFQSCIESCRDEGDSLAGVQGGAQ